MSDPPAPRGHIDTERPNPRAAELDRLGVEEALALLQEEDLRVHAALAAARPALARAIELVAERLARGGRLFYVGAGTSGRLGVLDAAECPPTFQSDPGQVQALIAGGARALVEPVEGAEDDPRAAGEELRRRGLGQGDVVFGISAGGTTPYVHGALACAREVGAARIFLACVPAGQAGADADVDVRLLTGPEVLAGSTRLKAGTATKLALNAVTTLAMARLGKIHGNLMVDVDTRLNHKLLERGARIVADLTGLPRAEALALLERAGGGVKVAVVMHAHGEDAGPARERLRRCGGFLRRALHRTSDAGP